MHLGKLYDNFDSRCRSYSTRINSINASLGTIDDWQYRYLTEVLISDIWQSWNLFCRDLFFHSCRGCTARDGIKIQPIAGDKSWHRLGYIARQANFNQSSRSNGHNGFLIRNEPTWGDLNVFIRIIQGVTPNNTSTLLSSYGSFYNVKHLQLVRNACGHKNIETLTDLYSLSSNYSFSNLDNATDMAWKTVVGGQDFAIELWLYEINLIAELSTLTV